ncbi:hypothetical protein BJX64DRAFT_250530, partial [Aspergillus heterothallicus]
MYSFKVFKVLNVIVCLHLSVPDRCPWYRVHSIPDPWFTLPRSVSAWSHSLRFALPEGERERPVTSHQRDSRRTDVDSSPRGGERRGTYVQSKVCSKYSACTYLVRCPFFIPSFPSVRACACVYRSNATSHQPPKPSLLTENHPHPQDSTQSTNPQIERSRSPIALVWFPQTFCQRARSTGLV